MNRKEIIDQHVQQLSTFNMNNDNIDLQAISDVIEVLFKIVGTEDLGDIVADAVSKGILTLDQGSRILNISRWSGGTNGAQLNLTLEHWLDKGTDLLKIKLALAQDVFLFTSKDKMKHALLKALQKHPQLEDAIKEKIRRRESLGF